MKYPLKKYLIHPLTILAILFCAPLPFLYYASHYYFENQKLDLLEERITLLDKKAKGIKFQKEMESSFLTQIEHADHFYLDKHLETLIFLEPEIIKLQALPYSLKTDFIKKRLEFLKEGSNRLRFLEETIRESTFQEVDEKLQHIVELNGEDLKKLLTLIEGVAIWPYMLKERRPQLIIKDFVLTKKMSDSQEPVFALDMQLIKREKLKK